MVCKLFVQIMQDVTIPQSAVNPEDFRIRINGNTYRRICLG